MTGIRRLAQHLDISIGTVSRALNGRPDVNEETRKRVLEAAAELGYVPNQSGRSLRQGTTNVIGFMMQTGTEITGQGDTFFMSVFDGVQTVFARHHLDLVALLCSSEEDPDDYLRRVVARGFADGLILSATQRHDPRFEFLAKRKIPFVTLGRSLTDVGQPWLDLDFEGMAQTSIDRLVAKGHRRIAVTRPHDDINLGYLFVDQSCQGACARTDLTLDPDLIFRSTPNEAGGYQIAQQLLAKKDRPTAILLVNETHRHRLLSRPERSRPQARARHRRHRAPQPAIAFPVAKPDRLHAVAARSRHRAGGSTARHHAGLQPFLSGCGTSQRSGRKTLSKAKATLSHCPPDGRTQAR